MGEPIALVSHNGERLVLYAPSEAKTMVRTGKWTFLGDAPPPESPLIDPATPTDDEIRERAKEAGIKHWWTKKIPSLLVELEAT